MTLIKGKYINFNMEESKECKTTVKKMNSKDQQIIIEVVFPGLKFSIINSIY